MTAPVKHGAISLGIHLIAIFLMLVVFKWEIYALVGGNIVFSLCMCILNARAMRKETGYHQEVKKTFLIPLGAAAIMGITILIVWNALTIFIPDKLSTIFTIVVAVLAYGISLLRFGGLSSDEIMALPKGASLLRIFQKLHFIKEEY